MPFTNGFVGLENYRILLADERFWSSLLVSMIYTGSTVVLQVVLGLALAVLVIGIGKDQRNIRRRLDPVEGEVAGIRRDQGPAAVAAANAAIAGPRSRPTASKSRAARFANTRPASMLLMMTRG